MRYNDMKPLPLWKPSVPMKFNTGMEQNSPFIITKHLQRSDLGACIISTTWPRFVAKVHAFDTCPVIKEGRGELTEKKKEILARHEENRMKYLESRYLADVLGANAAEMNCTIKTFIESTRNDPAYDAELYPRTYDEEFDEPRLVAKVPGLNVYLELYGCLDTISEDEVPWKGYNGAYAVLERMSTWAQNIWERKDRRTKASRTTDYQPLSEWVDEYDETLRPVMYPKKGIGIWPDIDESRRPESMYIHVPKFDNTSIEEIKKIKEERARLAAEGKS